MKPGKKDWEETKENAERLLIQHKMGKVINELIIRLCNRRLRKYKSAGKPAEQSLAG